MNTGNEQMQVEFHNKATTTFVSVYHSFEDAVGNVSRRNEEFKFQQLKKHYATLLEHELMHVAKEVLKKHRDEKQVREIDPVFHQFIKDYLHRFIQKINDL